MYKYNRFASAALQCWVVMLVVLEALTEVWIAREVAPDRRSACNSCLQNLQRYGRSIMCDLWSARMMILIWMTAKKKAQLFA